MNENIRKEKSLNPSNFVHKAIDDLKAAKESHLNAADGLDHSIHLFEIGSEYWDHIDPAYFQTSGSGIAAVDFIATMAQEAANIRYSASNEYARISQFSGSADVFGSMTSTAHSVTFAVKTFDPTQIDKEINKPEKDEGYAGKFDKLDPELGRLYRQILQVRRRTTSHPEKSILSDIRQAYDHLISLHE